MLRSSLKKATLRRLIKMNEAIADDMLSGTGALEAILERTEKQVLSWCRTAEETVKYVPIKQVVLNALEKIEKSI